VKVRSRRGLIRIDLDYAESDVLASYLDDLVAALDELPADDPVRRRLFPDGYRDDPDAALEFRQLTEGSLRDSKIERISHCRAQIPEGGGQIELDGAGSEQWLTAINDLRLQLGVQLDVTEDDDGVIDPDASDAEARVVYYWLTALQDSLVQAVSA
jgi:Domain of unknown function (DUF2017)